MQSSDPATKDLAEPFFLKAAELDSTLAEAHVGLGAVHVDRYFRGAEGLRTGLEAADSRFRTALRIRPGFLRAVRGLINLSYEQGRCEVALQQAKANSAGRPDDVESQMTRAWAYALSGLPEKSVPILDRIITLEPRNSEAVWLGTFSRCWAGRYAESLASGKAYVRAFGEEPEMYTWMAIAADGLQRDEEAAAYFERALELFSDEESNMYSAFLAVSFYTRIGKPDRAQAIARHWIPLLQGRLEIAPDNLRAQCTLLGLLGALGMTAEVQQTTDELLDRLRNQSAMGGQALMFAVSASANVGDLARVRKLLGETGSRDLASFQQLLLPDWSRHVLTRPENEAALEAMPEYRSFVAAVRARVAELGARY